MNTDDDLKKYIEETVKQAQKMRNEISAKSKNEEKNQLKLYIHVKELLPVLLEKNHNSSPANCYNDIKFELKRTFNEVWWDDSDELIAKELRKYRIYRPSTYFLFFANILSYGFAHAFFASKGDSIFTIDFGLFICIFFLFGMLPGYILVGIFFVLLEALHFNYYKFLIKKVS